MIPDFLGIFYSDLCCISVVLYDQPTFLDFFLDWKFYVNLAGSELPFLGLKQLTQSLNGTVVQSWPLLNKDILRDSYALQRLVDSYMLLAEVWLSTPPPPLPPPKKKITPTNFNSYITLIHMEVEIMQEAA